MERLAARIADPTGMGVGVVAGLASLCFLSMVGVFFAFTADDAYITARYAENLANGRGLRFNPGERIAAFTSPLHVFLLAGFELLTGRELLAHKLLAAAAVLGSMIWWCDRTSEGAEERRFLLVVAVMSPFLALWTVGGLETPFLVVTIAVLTGLMEGRGDTDRLADWGVPLAAAVAFLLRYDSVVFTAPAVLYLLIHRETRRLLPPLSVAGALVVGWLVFAWEYFGSILPTSFYIKTPEPSLSGTGYAVSFLVFSGLAGFAAPLVRARQWGMLRRELVAGWWLYAGALLVLVYGTLAGRVHMMFSYRLFLPYLPPLALVVVRLRRKSDLPRPAPGGLMALAGLQLFLVPVLLFWTVNPTLLHLAPRQTQYEYASEGVISYVGGFMAGMKMDAAELKAHWSTVPASRSRGPRLHTFAAGLMPYLLPSADVYEGLVSFRRDCSYDTRRSADYIYIMAPRHGTSEEQLGNLREKLHLMSTRTLHFDGADEHLQLWFNPDPGPHRLPSRVDAPCPTGLIGSEGGSP